MSAAAAVVHTAGVNWQATVAIVGGVVVIMSAVIGVFSRWIAGQITGAINQFRVDVVAQLDLRLTAVETKLSDLGRGRQR